MAFVPILSAAVAPVVSDKITWATAEMELALKLLPEWRAIGAHVLVPLSRGTLGHVPCCYASAIQWPSCEDSDGTLQHGIKSFLEMNGVLIGHLQLPFDSTG